MEPLTLTEACRSLKVGKTKLYALINARELPARKLGKKTIILRQDIEAYLTALPTVEVGRKGL